MREMLRVAAGVCVVLLVCPRGGAEDGAAAAWEPGGTNREAAIRSGQFEGYFARVSAWLDRKAPAGATEVALTAWLERPSVANALSERRLLAKIGPGNVGAFAGGGADAGNFLAWVLGNTAAMDLLLEAGTPIGLRAREADDYSLPVSALGIWKTIWQTDPESRGGLYLRLAVATALNPPGTGNRGAGQAARPAEPLDRYRHFKTAYRNGELSGGFDRLTAWEYRQIVSSNASNADLAWGREMVNAWRPDLRAGDRVVETTSQVWYRNSPYPYDKGFRSILEGGGKCGPRSSWAVFICQAFGIPAIGVGQPGHACVAYKAADGWRVAYGKGWNASRLAGLSGPEFLEGVAARTPASRFSRVERLRWLAAALSSKEQAAAVREIARKLAAAPVPEPKNIPAPAASANPASRPAPPVQTAPGVIHVEAAAFFQQGGQTCYGGQFAGVPVMDSSTGGRQLHFQANMATAWAGYRIKVPAAGPYELTARVSCVNREQSLYVRTFGAMAPVQKATASNVFHNMTADVGPQKAVDGDPGTRWAGSEGIDDCWLELDLGSPTPLSTVMIDERSWNRVSKFQVEYKSGEAWRTIFSGTNIGIDFSRDFPPVTARHVRLHILDTRRSGPTIWEFSVGSVKDGRAWLYLPNTHGLWQTTSPVTIDLPPGTATLWVFAPFQRGVSLQWLELKPKAVK